MSQILSALLNNDRVFDNLHEISQLAVDAGMLHILFLHRMYRFVFTINIPYVDIAIFINI